MDKGERVGKCRIGNEPDGRRMPGLPPYDGDLDTLEPLLDARGDWGACPLSLLGSGLLLSPFRLIAATAVDAGEDEATATG